MPDWFGRKIPLHELSVYILTRGLCLTALFLCSALLLLLCSSSWLAGWYAQYLVTMGAVLLGTSLIGPLLVEDILRKTK